MDASGRNVSLVGVCLWMRLWMACSGLFYFNCGAEEEGFRIVKSV